MASNGGVNKTGKEGLGSREEAKKVKRQNAKPENDLPSF
jgi:hypothetical protein